MPWQINRRPVGVDDVLGAKSWPSTISQMADQLVAVYDTSAEFDFARRAGQLLIGTTAGTATLQTWQAWVIPADEAWYIEAMSANYGVPVGGSAQVTVSTVEFGVTNLPSIVTDWGATAGAGLTARFSDYPRRWLGPGTTFTVNVQGSGLAAATVGFSVSGTRVRV